MLMSWSPSVVKTFAATPGWRLHSRADDRDLAHRLVRRHGADAELVDERLERARAARTSSRGTVNDMSARAPSDSGSFWMIMSMLTFASASAVVMRPATPGVSGTPSERHAGLAGRVGDGGDERLFHGLLLGDDNGTGRVVEARSAVDAHAVVAGVLDAAQLQDARARGGHLEHLLERDDGQLARVGHDPRVGAEDAGDVGVDLADVGADGGGQRDRGRVRAAAPERRDVLGGRDALEAGHEHDASPRRARAMMRSARTSRMRALVCEVSVTMPACEPVSEIARWPRSLMAIAHSAHDTRSPVDRSMSISRGSGTGETSNASAIRRSVSLPRALSTATTRSALLALGHDPPRGALEALGVGDRRAAELHDDRAGVGAHCRAG